MISFRKDIALFNKDYLPPKRAGYLTANIMHNDDILNKKRRLTFTLSLSTAVDVPGRTVSKEEVWRLRKQTGVVSHK